MKHAKPLRGNGLVRSITTDLFDLPSDPADHVYQEIDDAGSYRRPVPLRPPPTPPMSAHVKAEPEADQVVVAPRPPLPPPPPPPRPRPRPRLPPPPSSQPLTERTLPRQTSAPGLQGPPEHSPVYEERKVRPPPPPKTYMYGSLPSLAAGASLYRPPPYSPEALLADEFPRPDVTVGGPQVPARPSRPPTFQRPPLNSSSSYTSYTSSSSASSSPTFSSRCSSSGYSTEEPLYEEVKEHTYLHVLPDRSRRYTDLDRLLEDWKTVDICDSLSPGVGLGRDARDINLKAITVTRALGHFKSLLDALQQRVSELTAFCEDLDKRQKKTKTMGIAGGTTGAVGGVAAVVGVALAPATMGVSLVVTAIGAGMVATAGGIGARAAIADSRSAADRAAMEAVVRDYTNDVVDLERCLLLLRDGMDKLSRHDGAALRGDGVLPEALRTARLSQSLLQKDMLSASGMAAATKGRALSVILLRDFSGELDLYFTEKKGRKLKKSSQAKFACRVRQLVKDLQEVLDDLNRLWEMFSS